MPKAVSLKEKLKTSFPERLHHRVTQIGHKGPVLIIQTQNYSLKKEKSTGILENWM